MMRLRTVLQFWSIALGLLLVLVGSGGVAAQGAKGKAPAKLDLNSTTEAEIEAIKGVGPATAKKIVAGRPYEGTDVAQALEKAGVAKSLIPKISSSFTLGPATAGAATTGAAAGAATGTPSAGKATGGSAKAAATPAGKLDLNSATEAEIEAIKGVGPATAKKIVAGRPYEGTDVAKALEQAGVGKSLIPKISSNFTLGPAAAGAATTGAAGGAATSGAGGTKTSTVPSGTTAPSSTASSSAAAGKSTTTAKAAPADDTPAKTPPQKGMVWVNTDSGVFHKEGSRWYGKTKEGKWMTEADAVKAGFRAAKNE